MCRGRYVGILRPGCPRRFVTVVKVKEVYVVWGSLVCKIFKIEIGGDGLCY